MHISLLFHSERTQKIFVSVVKSIHCSDIDLSLPGMSALANMHTLVENENTQPVQYRTDAVEFERYMSDRYPGRRIPLDSPVIITSTAKLRVSLIQATKALRGVPVKIATLREEIMLEDLRANGETLIICDPIYRSLIGSS